MNWLSSVFKSPVTLAQDLYLVPSTNVVAYKLYKQYKHKQIVYKNMKFSTV